LLIDFCLTCIFSVHKEFSGKAFVEMGYLLVVSCFWHLLPKQWRYLCDIVFEVWKSSGQIVFCGCLYSVLMSVCCCCSVSGRCMPVHLQLTSLNPLAAVLHTVITGHDLVHLTTDNQLYDHPTVPQESQTFTLISHPVFVLVTLAFTRT